MHGSRTSVEIRIVTGERPAGCVFGYLVGSRVFIALSDGDSSNLHAAIDFVRETYGLVVVHVTRDVYRAIMVDPVKLRTLIRKAVAEQARLGGRDHYVQIAAAKRATAAWRERAAVAKPVASRSMTASRNADKLTHAAA
ncbi:MAG TPA: hypothetical protein VMS08_05250 [Candidatus Saccharimonadia bacterium]|nr:hypothetical protein [Candidatus Saccharimonadia bacterium]